MVNQQTNTIVTATYPNLNYTQSDWKVLSQIAFSSTELFCAVRGQQYEILKNSSNNHKNSTTSSDILILNFLLGTQPTLI